MYAETLELKTTNMTKQLRGEMCYQEPMSKHTSWRVGGNAEVFFKPADVQDLSDFFANHEVKKPVYWIGLGSNLLVRDGGIQGTVIVTSGLLSKIELQGENTVRIEAGVACPKAARFVAKQNLVGAEFLAGIPGTIGGALAMNAGAFGGETWQKVVAVDTMDELGVIHHRLPAEYAVRYREVSGPSNEWFIAGYFRFEKGDGQQSLQNMKQLLERRNATQPANQPSCGSVFRNPPGDYAARLIEACGLKGFCIGGACVSEKHANFIINTGNASATDIETLIEHVSTQVQNQHGIQLIREAHILGEKREN